MQSINIIMENPEKYRAGNNYKCSNIVFPVEFEGRKYIIKRSRQFQYFLRCLYSIEGKLFYGNRKLEISRSGIKREGKCLDKLNGFFSPRSYKYNQDIILREYIDGIEFKDLDNDLKRQTMLEESLEALIQIHHKDVIIGDANIKNVLKSRTSVYWIDFEGLSDDINVAYSKVIDLMLFIYSIYTITRNEDLTLYAAEIVSKKIDGETEQKVKELVTPGLSATRLWIPTRISITGNLNENIKRVLRN